MADINMQMKQRNGALWDNLYPKTTAANVIESTAQKFVSDTEKATWNGKQSSLGFTPENTATKNVANGYAGLDANSKINASQLPAIAISDTFVVATQVAMLALTAEVGDVAVRTDLNKSYILKTNGASTLANWQELLTPTDAVASVAGKTGVVTLAKADVGLGNVDNTTDALKPVSTATQTALNLKSNLASPTFTGTPLAPTAVINTNTTQVATTAFVVAQTNTKANITVNGTEPSTPIAGDFWYEII